MKTFRLSPAAQLALRIARLLVALILTFSNVMAVPMAAVAAPAAPAIAQDTPTDQPTTPPTADATATPTDEPTATAEPTATDAPTDAPTATAEPTATDAPTAAAEPTVAATDAPTATDQPTATATDAPTATAEPTATATTTPAGPMSSLIVRMVSGLTAAQQQAVIARNGGVETAAISVLRMHFVDAPSATINDTLASYRADAQVASAELDKTRDAGGTPDDTRYADQWALPKIGWDQAYGSVNPSGSATLAVLDTGVQADHPDLSGRVVAGFSAFAGGDPQSDSNGHGTAMTGIAAASTNNGTGIAGVAYKGVKIMPVQVLGADGTGQDSDIIEGVVWAADHGADVILMSFSNPGYSPALQAAVDYAWSKNVVLVAATGNDGSSTANFPAGDSGVIGVSATDQDDTLASSSNYGADTFLAAPGVGIETTNSSGGYSSISGTSASAAIVAGAAALLRADSGASNGVIAGRLARNADPAGTQAETGNGRVNLARALADTDSTSVKPAGAAPVGGGGPFVGPYVAAGQGDGTGTMTVSPSSVTASTTGNTLTFTFTTDGKNQDIFQVTVVVPSGWTTPTNSNTSVINGSSPLTPCTGTPTRTVSGFTITINISGSGCVGSNTAPQSFKLIYSSVTAPTTVGPYTFTTQSKGAGNLANIATQPVINVRPSVTNVNPNNGPTAGGTNVTITGTGFSTTAGQTTIKFGSNSATNVSCSSSTSCTATSPAGTGTVDVTVTTAGQTSATSAADQYTYNSQASTSLVVSSASGTYGGSVNLSATLTSGSNGVSGKNISFTLNGNSVGSATTNSSGVAALNSVSLIGINAGTYATGVGASFAGDSGFSASNNTASLTISPKTLTPSITANNKTYDGTTAATIASRTLTGIVGSDDVSLTGGTASFADKNLGTGKTVTATGLSLSGTAASNYTLSSTSATTTANITAKALTGSITASNKTYDGTAITSASGSLGTGVIGGETVNLVVSNAHFADKNVGNGKTVTADLSLSGADASNYSVNSTASTTANITARALTITATGVNKAYDGTTAATVTLTDNRISGDVFTDSYASATFDTKNVGTGKTITVSGISISGADAGNYTFNTNATTTANITARSLTVTATGVNKVYDGTTAATVTLSDDRASSDDVTTSYTGASFANKNVGTGKTVSVSGISISGGADAGNYTLANISASTTANITARSITVTAASDSRVYDGTAASAATPTITSGILASGDTASFTQSFADKNVGTGKTLTPFGTVTDGNGGNNYAITFATATGDITARLLTITATGVNKAYDGTTAATVTLSDDHLTGDTVTASYTSATFDTKNVGTGKTITVSGISISGADAGNYTANTDTTATADITPLAIVGSITASNKVYDGTTSATIASRTLTGAINGDDVSLTGGTAAFANKNVGTGKTITATGLDLSGADAGNYTVNSTATTTADITARALTVTATGIDKAYDGTTAATVTLSDDRVSGDAVTTSYTGASFADKSVGTGKTVSVSGISITGADAGNYTANTTTTTTANITARALVVTATGVDKVYDGTTDATVTLSDDRQSGDVLTVTYTAATFADKSVGAAKVITVSGISISGADAGNYTPNTTTTATASITARALTITATGVNKTYDGTSAASVNLSSDKLSGDDVSASYTSASFSDKNVGTNKPVSVSGISITGADAGNYALSATTASTTADITARTLTINASGVDKVYNGTTAATVTLTDNRISGDSFTDSYTSASFSDKNVGANKPVSVSGISISGDDAGNYTANTTASTTADITAKALTGSITASSKVYDGTTAASVNGSLTGAVSGDDVTLVVSNAAFDTKNVGDDKTVTASLSLTGGDAGNYTVNPTASAQASITARTLTVSATGVNKVYDGTATATVTLADDKVSGDDVTDSYTSASFSDKNVGTNKTVSVSGISIAGADAGNYTFNTSATTSADITAKALTITATGVNKVYDGTTAATVTLSDNRTAGDSFTDSYTAASFADKNVGTGKAVSVSGISISGTDAGNYSFNTTASAMADITARTLTVSASGHNKVYDGTTDATVTLSDNRVSGDDLTTSYTTASFDNKNVGIGKSVSVTGIIVSGTDAGNYTANTTASTTADITARALTVSATGINKTYDGTATASVTLSDDRVSGDDLSTSYASASFADKNVGTGKAESVTGISISGTDAGNYTANTIASTTADITSLAVTGSITASNKVYDGTTTATINGRSLTGTVSGDDVSLSGGSATFSDKNVGNGKTVTATGLGLSGDDAGNYTVNSTATTTADITSRALNVTASAENKVYDGTTAATVTLSDDKVVGDDVTTSYTTASFTDKNVGTGKTVGVSDISISGTDAGNYTFNTTASTMADITPRALVVTAHGINKVYDGTTAATVSLSDDRVSGDALSTSYTSASFANKNVGTGKSVSVSGISISGTNASNYTANTTASTTADITTRALTVSATGISKVYEGTTTASVNLSDDRVSGDDVTTSYTSATFADKNVGARKSVSVSGISISGADAGNYTANTTASTTADITARALTVSATGINKTYDGTTAATVNLSDDRVSGDDISTSYISASFVDKNVGTGKGVSVSGISISGADAGNYIFNSTATTSADITTRALTGSITASDKIYDGNSNASASGSIGGVVNGDDVTVVVSNAVFDNKNIGDDKPVTADLSLNGTDAGNYTLSNTTAGTTASITARVLVVSVTGINKVYDGTTAATVTLSDDRVLGDELTASYTTATFADKNVGSGKTVGVSGISISGTDAGNYTFNTSASTTADITARALTITATGVNKVYDGTTGATVTLSDNRVAGDVFTNSYTTASYANKNVGTGKTVTVTGISISGADAGNYTFNTSASTTADITARALTITATGVPKVYDGTTTAYVILSDNRVSGDVFSDSYTTASYANKNVGTGKTVSVSGISISGTDAGNYTFNTTASTMADITPRTLTVSATGVNKVYDGTTAATVTLSDNRVSGDSLTTSYIAASFVDKNVGTAKAVSVSGISISGTDAGNYTFNTTASTTADITTRVLFVTAHGINKVYDGNTNATVTLSDDRVSGDTLSTSYTSASFANKNVGTGKIVSVTGISVTGADAGNYTFNTTASTTANITAFALTVSATGINKVYDGNTNATVTLSDNRVNGDVFTDSYTSASFADKNVGTGKTVSVSGISISGADAGNYTFNTTASTTADITPRTLTVSATGVNKAYDGTTAATVTLSDNRVLGDIFTVSYGSASFNNKNVGTAKPVSVSGISISGADAGNYTFNTTASTTANITPRALMVSATGQNKVYDGTTAATVTLSDNRVSGDSFTDSYTSASFANKNVGTGKTVSVTGISISGTDAGNYTFNTTASTTADITALGITGSFTAANKVYDGTTAATVSGRSLVGTITGDNVSLTGGSASFDTKNVGTGKIVTGTGFGLTGTDAGNYTLLSVATTTANITPRPITVTADPKAKIFGSADPALTFQVTSGSLAMGDNFSGSLIRDIGEDVGTYAIRQGTLTAGSNYNLSYVGANFIITAANTTTIVSVTPSTVQYSDLFTLNASVSGPGTPTGTVQFKIDGTSVGSSQALAGGSASLSNYQVMLAPGPHQVTAVFTSNSANWTGSTSTAQTLTVIKEDARATYTGTSYASTGSATASKATITLAATIQDITAVTGDPAYDANAGDIRNAKVTFTANGSNIAGCVGLTVGLVSTSDTKTGTATCTWIVDIGSNDSLQYTIGIIVDGYYTRNAQADDTVVTVSKNVPGMLTGGGYIINQRSAGQKPGETGLRTNFGFNAKTTKNGVFQGNVNIIVRNGGRVYQIKSNAISSIGSKIVSNCAVSPYCTGTFSGKANIQDITNPLAPISVDGGASLQITLTDKGEPGSSDSVAITLWDKNGGLWFSSNWDGTKTIEQVLNGGNLAVR